MPSPLSYIPERPGKPRSEGLLMVMDKGLSTREAEDLAATAGPYIDFVKLGFGTPLVTKNLKEKIKIYGDAGISPYFGGTLFEAFAVRQQLSDYKRFLLDHNLTTLEISDGSIAVAHDVKLDWISDFSQHFTVLSEVGSKQEDVVIAPSDWVAMMEKELEAGSQLVIAESRESGNTGIYSSCGSTEMQLFQMITQQIAPNKIMWEAPLKKQQAWFINKLGANVNLGNVSPGEVLALETLRLGLRGDTFFRFLPEKFNAFKP